MYILLNNIKLQRASLILLREFHIIYMDSILCEYNISKYFRPDIWVLKWSSNLRFLFEHEPGKCAFEHFKWLVLYNIGQVCPICMHIFIINLISCLCYNCLKYPSFNECLIKTCDLSLIQISNKWIGYYLKHMALDFFLINKLNNI